MTWAPPRPLRHTRLNLHGTDRSICMGCDNVDIAVRRISGAMIWHHALEPAQIPLGWLRAEIVH